MAVGDTRRLRVVIEGESSSAEQAFESTGDAAEKAEGRLSRVAKFMVGMGLKGSVALGAIGVAAGTMGLKTATQLEQVEVGFTTMLGSAEKARKFMGQLQQFAAATPFEFTELVGSAQRFLAMGFAARDIIPMLTAVGDAVAAMGGSAESVDAVTRALGQMQAKGKVSSEELLQLTEQGIPALQILADKFGVSAAEMQKMVTKGEVMSSKAIPALIDGLRNGTKNVQGFGGMMAKQSETMAGKWSTFMDTLQMGLGKLVANTTPALKHLLQTVSDAMQNFFAGLEGKGKLAGFTGTINEIGLGLRALVAAFKEGDVTSKGLVGKFELVGAAAHGVIEAFKTGKVESGGWRGELELVAAAAKRLIEFLMGTIHVISSVVGWFKQHENAAKTLGVAIFALTVLTKAHAVALSGGVVAGMASWLRSLKLVQIALKVSAALQWAYNGAITAAKWASAAVLLDGYLVKQKLVAAASKVAAAAQWAWNVALNANPIGLIVLAVAAVVAVIFLLWKHSDGFRKWVLGTLWPSLKRAWDQLKAIAEAVAGAVVAAWNWIKDTAITVWNAITGFLSAAASKIMIVLSPIINVIKTIGNIFWTFYTNVWKVVWILIQIAAKIVVEWFSRNVVPWIQAGFEVLKASVKGWQIAFAAVWNFIKNLLAVVAGWFTNTIVPSWKRAGDQLKMLIEGIRAFFKGKWDAIVSIVRTAWQTVAGPIANLLKGAIDKIKYWIEVFRLAWDIAWDRMKNKITNFKDGVVKGFNLLKDGVKAAWDKLVQLAKSPVNFLIQNIYDDRIVPFWNRVAEKFGIKTRLDTIPRLATGGLVPGTGFGDKIPAMLTPGEGVLSLPEMKMLGGAKGFSKLRELIQGRFAGFNAGGTVRNGVQFLADGGVAGFFSGLVKKGKDFFQGMAAKALQPLADTIKRFIGSVLPGDGISGLLRGGGIKVVDSFMAWIRGKDKEGSPTGAGGFPGALAWARTQAGKPYIWASAGPGGYDCSGFMSAILNHLQGRALYQRRFSTGDAGGGTLAGALHRNKRSPFMIGVVKGNPGHTAGTLNGVNVESRGSRGVVVGPAARGWSNALFSMHYGFKRGGVAGDPPFDFLNPRGPNYMPGAAAIYKAAAKNKKLMDGVSTLEPGWNLGYNATGRRETVVNSDMLRGHPRVVVPVTVVGTLTPQQRKELAKSLAKDIRDQLNAIGGQNGRNIGLKV